MVYTFAVSEMRGSGLDSKLIVAELDRNPWDEGVCERLLAQARVESGEGEAWNYYRDELTADELGDMVRRLRSARTLEERYRLMAEKAANGDYWLDVVQGMVYEHGGSNAALEGFVSQRQWQSALDLGSGTGMTSTRMTGSADKLVSADRFEFLLELARGDVPEGSEGPARGWVAVDARGVLPFSEGAFDLVVANGLSAFIPRERFGVFAGELFRVLKPGGVFLEPMPDSGEVMRQYKQSAKGLLVYMLGELMTSPGPGKSGAYPHNYMDLVGQYMEAGFEAEVEKNDDGSAIAVYRKPGEDVGP